MPTALDQMDDLLGNDSITYKAGQEGDYITHTSSKLYTRKLSSEFSDE